MIKLKKKKLILASKSPRRQELLRGLGLDFEIRLKDTEETYPDELPPHEVAVFLAKKKALAFQNEVLDQEIVIASDTVVVLEDKILGKPVDAKDAIRMLKALSGKKHMVYTGLAFLSKDKVVAMQDETEVSFKELSLEEIEYYVKNYKPFDKAGGYGIQEWIGHVGIEKIKGSYCTVVGFPVHLVYEVLINWDK